MAIHGRSCCTLTLGSIPLDWFHCNQNMVNAYSVSNTVGKYPYRFHRKQDATQPWHAEANFKLFFGLEFFFVWLLRMERWTRDKKEEKNPLSN